MSENPDKSTDVRTPDEFPIDQDDLRQQMETRAYFRYCEHGCLPGRELEDWLFAEQEVLAARAITGTAT